MMYWYRYKEDIVITLNVTSSFHDVLVQVQRGHRQITLNVTSSFHDVLVQVQRGHRHHIKCN